jgi:septal ring factor EnvC (AmiA/AmiB activator)
MPPCRSTLHRPLSLRLLLGAWLLAAAWACAPALAAKQASEADLKKLKNNIAELQKQIGKDRSQHKSLQKMLRDSEISIGLLKQKASSVQKDIDRLEQELKALNEQREELEHARLEQQRLITQQVVAAYRIGRERKLKVLLNQERPERVARALTYYDYFNRARAGYVTQYSQTVEALDAIKPEITTKTDALLAVRDRLLKQQREIHAQQVERQKALTQLSSTIQNKDAKLKKLQKDSKELERLVYAVDQTINNLKIPADYRPFKAARGNMPWPVAGNIISNFGSLRAGTDLRWQGVMIAAREGSPVHAVHHGRVVFADWFRGKGLLIIIDHGEGYMSLYAHNQSLLRQTGDWVNAGEQIATSGMSGGLSRASLYFEIRERGQPTDPKRWCRARG